MCLQPNTDEHTACRESIYIIGKLQNHKLSFLAPASPDPLAPELAPPDPFPVGSHSSCSSLFPRAGWSTQAPPSPWGNRQVRHKVKKVQTNMLEIAMHVYQVVHCCVSTLNEEDHISPWQKEQRCFCILFFKLIYSKYSSITVLPYALPCSSCVEWRM